MMILPLIFLIFLRFEFIFSTSYHSSFMYGQWSNYQKGKYANTLPNLLETLSLSSQTSKGFYNFSSTLSKTSNNQLHGLYLCRGDVDPQTCQSCVDSAKNSILEEFPCSVKGLVLYDHCMVRYSNESFFGKGDLKRFLSSSWNGEKIKGSRILFMKILMKTMKGLAIEASKINNSNKFATKVVKILRNETLYATVQCTPDLVARDCYMCLSDATQKLLNMRGSVEGHVLYTSCMVEYKTTSSYKNYMKTSIFMPLKATKEDNNNSTVIPLKDFDDAEDTNERVI